MAGLIGVRECSGHDVTKFRDVAHVNAPHSRIKRESPAHGSVSLFLRSKNADKVLIVERRDNERMIRKTGFFHYPVNLGLAGKMGNVNLPPLIASTSGSVDQTKCLTPASLAARTAAVAWSTSSVPPFQKLVTRNTPCAPSNAGLRVSGRFKSALMISSPTWGCSSGLRVSARTLNCLFACRARTTAPPCCPVAPTTAIRFLFVRSICSVPLFQYLMMPSLLT